MPIDTIFHTPETRTEPAAAALPPRLLRPEPGCLRLVWDAESSERSRNLAFEMLAALSVAVFIVNSRGEVRLTNSAAERLVRAHRGIAAWQRRLMLSDAGLDAQLRAALLRIAANREDAHACEMLVARGRIGAPLSLLIIPVPQRSETSAAEALAAVLAGGPVSNCEPPMELVRLAYGLTPAETRVLFAVVGGWRACDYADAMGLSQDTVRTQLKTLFAKMDCHRQADLVRKVLSDPILRLSGNFGRRTAGDHPNG